MTKSKLNKNYQIGLLITLMGMGGLEDNSLPPPNYPSYETIPPVCAYCGKSFETVWHVASHQWACDTLNKAIKRFQKSQKLIT